MIQQVNFRTSGVMQKRTGAGEALAKLITKGAETAIAYDKKEKALSEEEDRKLSEAEQISYNNYIVDRENKRRDNGYYDGRMKPAEELQFLSEEKDAYNNHFSGYKSKWFKTKSASILSNYDRDYNKSFDKYTTELANTVAKEQIDGLIRDETSTGEDYTRVFNGIKEIKPSITDESLVDMSLSMFKNAIANIPDEQYRPDIGSKLVSGIDSIINDDSKRNIVKSIVENKNARYKKMLLDKDNKISDNILLSSTESNPNINGLIDRARKEISDDGVKYTTVRTLQSLQRALNEKSKSDVEKRLKDIIDLNKEKLKVSYDTTSSFWTSDGENVSLGMKDIYSQTDTAIENAYFGRPEKIELEKKKVYDMYNESMRISQEVEEHNILEPTPDTYNNKSYSFIEEKRAKSLKFSIENGFIDNASKLIVANNGIPKDVSIDLRREFISKDPQRITDAVNTIASLSTNGNVARMIRDDKYIGDIFSYAEIAVKNGLSDKEIDTMSKIITGETDYSIVKDKGRNILRNIGVSDSTSTEYQAWLKEANYLASMNLPDKDIEELLEATMENKRFYTDKNEAYVFYAPKWASNNVIDNIVDIISVDNPSISSEGFSFKSDGRGSDRLIVSIGQGDRERPIAYIDEREYLTMLGMYRDAGLDEEYKEQQLKSIKRKVERNYNNALRTNSDVSGKSAKEWKEKLSEIRDALNNGERTLIEKLILGEDLR